MKRGNEESSLEDPIILIKSDISQTKRIRQNSYVPKPSIIKSQELLPNKSCFPLSSQFIENNQEAEVLQPYQSIRSLVKLEDLQSYYNKKPLMLVFFGITGDYVLEYIDSIYDVLKERYDLEVLGVSCYITSNNYSFPIINDNKGALAKYFNTLDPVGGGAYPLDTIILFDHNGRNKVQAPIGIANQFRCNKPVYLGDLENMIIECLSYFEHHN